MTRDYFRALHDVIYLRVQIYVYRAIPPTTICELSGVSNRKIHSASTQRRAGVELNIRNIAERVPKVIFQGDECPWRSRRKRSDRNGRRGA